MRSCLSIKIMKEFLALYILLKIFKKNRNIGQYRYIKRNVYMNNFMKRIYSFLNI